MMKDYYKISLEHFAALITPIVLRKTLYLAFAGSMIKPAMDIHRAFIDWAELVEDRQTGQVCVLEKMLNDRYDYSQRRIYIAASPFDQDYCLLWKEAQNHPMMIWKESSTDPDAEAHLLERNGMLGTVSPDFDVVFPALYVMSESEKAEIKQFLNSNKLASKKYRLINGQN